MIFENYNIGAEAIKNQQYKESIQHFTKAINENNSIGCSFSLAYFYRATAYYYTGEFEKAIADFDESSNVMSDDFKFYLFRGLTYFSLKKYDEAETDFNKVIKINVDFSQVNIYLYEIYKIKNKDNLSLTLAKKIIESNPRGINELSNLGTKFLDQDDFLVAKNIYLDIYKLCPGSVSAVQGLAIANGHLKNYEESITFFDLLIKLDPENTEHHKKNRELSLNEINNVQNLTVSNSKDTINNSKQNPNKWQNDICAALEKEESFDIKKWKSKFDNDDYGLDFMEEIAKNKNIFDYISELGLVNRGFCPITGEKIDKSFNYSIYGRTIYVSEKALELGKEKKQKFMEQFQKENPNYEANLKQAKAFVAKANPYIQKPKYDNITFFGSLFLSGYLSYKIVSPVSVIGYIGVVVLFILIFGIADWLRKKI